jgi:predicted RNase H-like nuclease
MKPTGNTDQMLYVAVKGPNFMVVVMGLDIDSKSAWKAEISNYYALIFAFGKFSSSKDRLYFGV